MNHHLAAQCLLTIFAVHFAELALVAWSGAWGADVCRMGHHSAHQHRDCKHHANHPQTQLVVPDPSSTRSTSSRSQTPHLLRHRSHACLPSTAAPCAWYADIEIRLTSDWEHVSEKFLCNSSPLEHLFWFVASASICDIYVSICLTMLLTIFCSPSLVV